MTENEREDHVLVDLFGLLGVKCVFVVQPKMLKETYGLCRLVLEMNGQSTEDWITSFMEANLGRTADAIVAAQPISEILFALAVKAMRGTPLRHHKTVAMTDTHDRRMCIIPGGPDRLTNVDLLNYLVTHTGRHLSEKPTRKENFQRAYNSTHAACSTTEGAETVFAGIADL